MLFQVRSSASNATSAALQGQTIRSPVASVRIAGRATQGVTLFRLEPGERVVSVERIEETSADSANGS